jgi:4-hydroxy 2-oxovalerate aldolase
MIKLLDCTLRDGGYYVKWDFPTNIVQDYLQAMSSAGVNVVELGFRFLQNEGFYGPTAYTTDEYIRSLDVPDELVLAVMVNGSDLLTDGEFDPDKFNYLFPEGAISSKVKLVRVACHFKEVLSILPVFNFLKELGFDTGLNLMQITERTEDEIINLSVAANDYPIDVLYFADSLGGMRPVDVRNYIELIKMHWKGEIGIHTHDNLGLGLINSLEAKENGVTWIDSTVTGMGRGPGNTCTEYLLQELNQTRGISSNYLSLYRLIKNYFSPLKKIHSWGTNHYYYLSGLHGIHPTYVQDLLSDIRYEDEDIASSMDYLINNGGSSYKKNWQLKVATTENDNLLIGAWSPRGMCRNKDVVLIGSGPSVIKYKRDIEYFIRTHGNLSVFVLNMVNTISESLIDFRISCHPLRITADIGRYRKSQIRLIAPKSCITEAIRSELDDVNIFDYGMNIRNDQFSINDNYCILPNNLGIAYSLAVLTCAQADRVYLIGFDGFSDREQNLVVDDVFMKFKSASMGAEIISLTPTNYLNIQHKSIFSRL